MPSRPFRPFLVPLLWVALACACHSRAGADGSRLFALEDPRGDDHGDGDLRYPLRKDLNPGDLDLLSLAAFDEGTETRFEATFARPIAVPSKSRAVDIAGGTQAELARYGFYTFNLDVYVDTDRQTGSGHLDALPGRGLVVDPGTAWDRAIVLTPRPLEALQLLRKEWETDALTAFEKANGPYNEKTELQVRMKAAQEVDSQVFFPTRVRVQGTKVSFWVPNHFLGGEARADWGYGVVVTGATLDRRVSLVSLFGKDENPSKGLMVMRVSTVATEAQFGGGRRGDPGQSPAVDLIVAPGTTQEKVLGATGMPWTFVVPAGGAVPAPVAPVEAQPAPADTVAPAAVDGSSVSPDAGTLAPAPAP